MPKILTFLRVTPRCFRVELRIGRIELPLDDEVAATAVEVDAHGDIDKFSDQYGGLMVKTSLAFHDRFLIIDGKELYLIGASLKDLGRKCFGFTKMDAGEIAGIRARVQ